MRPLLHVRAGSRALARLRERGLVPEDVRAVVGTASGPRWLALVGLDRALMEAGLAAAPPGSPARLLVGASAGAWRCLAFAARDPAACHARLVDGYVTRVFARGVRPAEVSRAYRRMLADVFAPEDVRHALAREATDLAIHVARLRGPWPWSARAVQAAALATTALARRAGVDCLPAFVERVLVHARPDRFAPDFDGRLVRLDAGNAHEAALASGTVPLAMAPVRAIAGAPRGRYVDGGLSDYHLRQRHVAPGAGLVLLPHFQERVDADWFARHARRRRGPDGDVLADVVQMYPSRAYVETLPDARLPDREDFYRDADRPEARIARWREAVARSEVLRQALLDDLAAGRLVDRVEPLTPPA